MEIIIKMTTEQMSESQTVRVEQKDEGSSLSYNVPYTRLLATLQEAQTVQSQPWGPILPKDVIQTRKQEDGYDVVMEIPKQQHPIIYEQHPFVVGFPRMLMRFRLREQHSSAKNMRVYQVSLQKIVCIKGEQPIKEDTDLYHFPYSHVDGDGNVCMGGIPFPEVPSIQDMQHHPAFFFQTPFGSDYESTVVSRINVSQLMTETFVDRDFDEDELVPLNETYQTFMAK